MTSFATRRASFRFLFIFLVTTAAVVAQSNTGRISGRAVDSSNGRGVANVAVTVVGANQSANTDVSGRYVIEGVPAGTYEVAAEKVDFRPATITGVTVLAGESTTLDLPLAPAESVIRMEVMTVSAEVVQNSDIGLLNARHKSAAVSDAIGGDQFARLAVGDAAEAMSKVTGASIVGGKYVLIRGLGDRYSNTLLNGTAVPSADPDKRAVQMDQFPSDLIDAITTTKSFTPDQPGAFSGGSVNVKTKAFPDQFFATVSVTAEYNDNTTGELILDAPVRGDAAPDLPSTIPGRTAAQLAARQGNFGPAEELDRASKAFASGNLFPGTTKAEPNFGASLALGNRHLVGEDGLFGYTASFSYERKFSHFEGGEANRFIGTPDAPQSRLVLTTDPELLSIAPSDAVTAPPFGVTSSTHSERRGGFAKLAYRPVENHEFTVDFLYNETTDSVIRRGVGEETINYVGSVFEVYDMLHTDRTVGSAQLSGKSMFPELNSLEVEWRAAVSTSTQDQPDYRTLAAVYMPDGGFVNATGVQPNRFFRELEEDATEGGLDVTYPFGEHHVKVGAMASSNERSYREQRFQYSLNPRSREELESFPNPVGIVSRTATSVTFGNTIQRLQEPNSYQGEQDISAAYAMADVQVTSRVRVIGGVRFEKTEMRTDPVPVVGGAPKIGMIDQTDALPALSVVFASSPKTNWRFAYGRTVARPTYKELTDIRYEDVFTGDVYLGNADLELTVIDNYDVRWEWFPRKGETVAVSAFYKRLNQPIEVLYGNAVGAIQPNNVDRGTVQGVEFEYRRNLKFLGNAFAELSVGTNLTFVESEVTIPAAELAILRAYDPQADDKRELLGQSPYIFNFDISYDRARSGTGVTLSYNIVGERLDLVNFGPLPDVFEQPAPLLNLVISQRLTDQWRLKFSAKNLLDPDHEKTIGLPDRTLIYARSNAGRSFALGLSCAF